MIMEFKMGRKIRRIIKLNPNETNVERLVTVLLKYCDSFTADRIATTFITQLYNDNDILLIVFDRNRIYEYSERVLSHHFIESEFIKTIGRILEANGIKNPNCLVELLFTAGYTNETDAEISKRKSAIRMEQPSWIPIGYQHIEGDMLTGYVISDVYGNEFTYIPYLEEYISRYEISKDVFGKPASIAGQKVWTNISYKQAMKVARNFDPLAHSDLLEDISKIGEAIKQKSGIHYPEDVYKGRLYLRTGAIPENMIYNIDCLTGNYRCITHQYKTNSICDCIDGKSYYEDDNDDDIKLPNKYYGFRIRLRHS